MKATNGGETDKSPRSEGEREEAERMPRAATTETAGARRDPAATSSATHSRQGEHERLGLGLDAGERESERGAQPIGPGWSGLTHSGWPDQWAQAVSQIYFFRNN
jgi:hypothetical protein